MNRPPAGRVSNELASVRQCSRHHGNMEQPTGQPGFGTGSFAHTLSVAMIIGRLTDQQIRDALAYNPAAVATGATSTGRGSGVLIPVSLVRLSMSALIATIAELPDIESAATSGDSVNG